MADEISTILKGVQIAKVIFEGGNVAVKVFDEAEKILNDIINFGSEHGFERKSAEMIKAKLKEGQDLCFKDCQTVGKQKEIMRSLTRLGIPFIESTMNIQGQDKPCILYASEDHDKITGLFEETLDISKQVPLERLKDQQCFIQHSNEKDLQLLKRILDENNVKYSITDNCDIIYPKKDEEKVKIANDVVAYQNQFPEVKKYQVIRDENITKNINTFVLLANGKLNEDNQHIIGIDKDAKDIGFIEKDGTGIIFDKNKVYVIEKENDKNVLNIYNRSEFVQAEEYGKFFDKLSRDPNVMMIQKEGISDELRKNGASKTIIEEIQNKHNENVQKIYSLSKEEEDRLNEISKMTQVYIIDEHPGGYKEMKLARCMFSSQAIVSSLREPDLDGPMDNKIPVDDIKENAKNEVEMIEYHTLTKEESEKIISLETMLGESNEEAISKIDDLVSHLSNEETSLVQD